MIVLFSPVLKKFNGVLKSFCVHCFRIFLTNTSSNLIKSGFVYYFIIHFLDFKITRSMLWRKSRSNPKPPPKLIKMNIHSRSYPDVPRQKAHKMDLKFKSDVIPGDRSCPMTLFLMRLLLCCGSTREDVVSFEVWFSSFVCVSDFHLDIIFFSC